MKDLSMRGEDRGRKGHQGGMAEAEEMKSRAIARKSGCREQSWLL